MELPRKSYLIEVIQLAYLENNRKEKCMLQSDTEAKEVTPPVLTYLS